MPAFCTIRRGLNLRLGLREAGAVGCTDPDLVLALAEHGGEHPLQPRIVREWLAQLRFGPRTIVDLDLDAFDPAYAPGVAHPVPGGLTPRQALGLIQEAPWRLVGMDAVEVNPSYDQGDRTAVLAARLLHEAMGRVEEPEG